MLEQKIQVRRGYNDNNGVVSLFKLGRTRGTAANLPLKNDIDNHLFFCVRVKGTVWKNEKYAFTLAIIGENSFQCDLVQNTMHSFNGTFAKKW